MADLPSSEELLRRASDNPGGAPHRDVSDATLNGIGEATATARPWNILVVDDEKDVHSVTQIALKRKLWRKRPFAIESVYSGAEAVELLAARPAGWFQVALIDVVMESDAAGLELCRHIRATQPSSVRIILRTGQAGKAPEEYVLNEYDVDHYLSKTEATPQKLYTLIRACLRSSQDISTLVAFATQLQNFTRALQNLSSVADLLVFMQEGLAFLELKHAATTIFFYDLDAPEGEQALGGGLESESVDMERLQRSIAQYNWDRLELDKLQRPGELRLGEHAFFIPFECSLQETAAVQKDAAPGQSTKRGALFFQMRPEFTGEKNIGDFCADASLFIENWKIAYATLQLQERLAREKMLREQMYYERLQSIATMVTGVAHELNTPLGVATTANGMVRGLARDLMELERGGAASEEDRTELVSDLDQSCVLLERNLERAQSLVSSFKQLSASQLAGERTECQMGSVIVDCVESMRPQMKKQGVKAKIRHLPEDNDPPWNGFPGHLSQVIINFLQNAMRYAYPGDTGGEVDIRLSTVDVGDEKHFCIEFADHGKGVKKDILPRIFEPFVTSGRGRGGTGLGLAISHNIVTNLLGGTLVCTTEEGKGTTFTVTLPPTAPDKDSSA